MVRNRRSERAAVAAMRMRRICRTGGSYHGGSGGRDGGSGAARGALAWLARGRHHSESARLAETSPSTPPPDHSRRRQAAGQKRDEPRGNEEGMVLIAPSLARDGPEPIGIDVHIG